MRDNYYAVVEILSGNVVYSGGDEYSELCCAKALVPGTVYAKARLEEIAVAKATEVAAAYRQQGYTLIESGGGSGPVRQSPIV